MKFKIKRNTQQNTNSRNAYALYLAFMLITTTGCALGSMSAAALPDTNKQPISEGQS